MLRPILILASLLGATPALAQDAAQQGAFDKPGTFDKFDAAFGKYLVAPLATGMFWDTVFWDNTLAPGELPERKPFMVGAEEVTGHGPDGYVFQKHFEAATADALPVLTEAVDRQMGQIQTRIEPAAEGVVGRVQPTELRLAPCASVDTCGTPIADWAAKEDVDGGVKITGREGSLLLRELPEDQSQVRIIDDRAPFPVAVVVADGTMTLLPGEFQTDTRFLGVEPGTLVSVDGQRAEVLEQSGKTLKLRSLQTRTDPKPLANPGNIALPLVVAWLVLGAVFFTLRMSFINLRGFGHAILVTTGKYDNADDEGEITHFKALSSALSATVGLGNIAGVAIAVATGGPGAIPWMIIAGFLGMSSKFSECTAGQMYREVDAKGSVSGGPMRYLERGLAELGLGSLGKVLAIVFAVMCIGGSLGGGNMFQANQSFVAVADVVPFFAPRARGTVVLERDDTSAAVSIPMGTLVRVPDGPAFKIQAPVTIPAGEHASSPVGIVSSAASPSANVAAGAISVVDGVDGLRATQSSATSGAAEPRGWLYGLLLAVAVGAVILGGIKRIGAAAGVIVPVMCGVYVLAAMWIILVNADQIPTAFRVMWDGAFSMKAGFGGFVGALVQGFRRAAFSNEAGIGSASIAHSAAATNEPVREGIVALLEPFIDTIVVCTMTGLVVVITGAYLQDTGDGVLMTSVAFGSVIGWFPMVLTFSVVMFAFSTMISWSYYGERCATYLFGMSASVPYKLVFLVFVFLGSVFKLGNVLDFSDLMVLGMAFPNIIGVVLLSGKIKSRLDDYWGRLQAGEM